MPNASFLPTPLCPAGHLSGKGGDQISRPLSPIIGVSERAVSLKQPISPLAGEMAGRPEGGVTEHHFTEAA
ncbi:lytic murein transglycosylase [Mesorhizobium sp. B2-3-3]|nr:lytic murein transglycosylase [Mesorhizobium sp. B2-3-3]